MTRAIAAFVAEVRRDLAAHADSIADAFVAVDIEGDHNPDATMYFESLHWIITQRCSLDERIRALHELAALQGKVVVNLRCRDGRILVKRL